MTLLTKTPVWSSNEATVFIFTEDDQGNPIGMYTPWEMQPEDSPLLEYLYGSGISVTQNKDFTRGKETGKQTYTLIDDGVKYSCTIGGLHCRSNELEKLTLFVPLRRFTVVFYLVTLLNRIERIQQHVLTHSMFASAGISTGDNSTVSQNVKIESENFIQYRS